MAQFSVDNHMERDLCNNLHDRATLLGIKTTNQFPGRDNSEIKNDLNWILQSLGAKIGAAIILSNPHQQLANALLQINRHYQSDCFERFRSLITFILAKEAQSNEELYLFINEEFNTPSSHRSFTSNSVETCTTFGLVNSSSNLPDVYPWLKRELNNLMYTDVPHLVDYFIRQHHPNSVSLLPDHIELASLLQPYENCINQKFKEPLNDTLEDSVLNWITPLLKHISDDLQRKISAPQHSRTWRSLRNQHINGPDTQQKLDGAIMSQYIKDQYHIQDILVPVELKKNESDAPDAVRCLARSVYEVFNHQPTRSFVVGFTLCGTLMQLWKFDRSGAIGSQSLNIKETEENFKKFLALIILFLTTNKQVLGFDPTFFDIDGQTCPPTPQKIQINTQPDPQELVIRRLIFRASGICGRGTTCWEAHLLGDSDQKFLIKDSWQPLDRIPEGHMLCDVTARCVPNVARYHHHEDVHVDSKIVDIKSYVRKDLEFMNCKKIETCSQSDHAKEPKNPFINRVHRRLILKDVGKPIWKVKTPFRLLEALEGCVKGHQAMLDAGYLHRDISINNLMINEETDDPARKSFLIDLDVAIAYPMDPNVQATQARIGTQLFMSINLLAQEHEHTFVDDLESFFWVLTWICIHFPAHQRKKSDITGWNRMTTKELKREKFSCLADPRDLTDEFTILFAESEPLIACVHTFAEIMRNPLVREEKSATLYGKILDLLRQAQGKPIERQ
ncbi:hypothetical protein PGT21_018012 [Puccinia graminis f. sp. tritici]|uniref:Fungal-type protein kinase domain-containing protein n=1 Tax=Puccinia graminis f. sp. tritici TaxID=56615 RepID=A0A5B0MJ96_PUCGR|nr:hypothetical protein PGT21_018012 [Puccinia graminis f. sp. tritici]KAA1126931.1 hypothetical protein PGTUg99_032269 [Puccinia graminis f. sp. tritici]